MTETGETETGMPNSPSGLSLENRAEEALRQAKGDWQKALRSLQDAAAADAGLRQQMLDRIIVSSLRKAALRLGTGTRTCPGCREEIAIDSLLCNYCGRPLAGAAPPGPGESERQGTGGPIIRHFTLLTGWILIVLTVILILSFVR